MDFKKLVDSPEYDFLRENPRLGRRIILMGLGEATHTEQTMKTATLISGELP